MGKKRNQRISFDVRLDFHGYTAEEALRELEEELFANDDCSFLIVHGKGDGILRSRIRGFLSRTDLIDGFEPGETANAPGGSGVTIART